MLKKGSTGKHRFKMLLKQGAQVIPRKDWLIWRVHSKVLLGLAFAIMSSHVFSESAISKNRYEQVWTSVDGLMTVEIGEEKGSSSTLHIRRGNLNVFTYRPKFLYPSGMFELDDGNLLTLWTTGAGGDEFYHLVVFNSCNRTIKIVLDAKSATKPEFVFCEKSFRESKKGSYPKRSIILANTNWANVLKGSIPATANIYTWSDESSSYRLRKNVSWTNRMR